MIQKHFGSDIITEATVKAFDMSLVHRLSGADEFKLYAMLLRPGDWDLLTQFESLDDESKNDKSKENDISSLSYRVAMRLKPFNRLKSLSISLRFLYSSLSYSHGFSRLGFGGTTGS